MVFSVLRNDPSERLAGVGSSNVIVSILLFLWFLLVVFIFSESSAKPNDIEIDPEQQESVRWWSTGRRELQSWCNYPGVKGNLSNRALRDVSESLTYDRGQIFDLDLLPGVLSGVQDALLAVLAKECVVGLVVTSRSAR